MYRENLNLVDQYNIIKKRKKLLLFFLITSLLIVTTYNILVTRLYRTETTIISIESTRTNPFGSFSGLNNIQALSGIMGSLTSSSSKDKLLNILNSRSLTENVINNLNLMPIIFSSKWDNKKNNWKNPDKPPFLEDAVKLLQKKLVTIRDTRSGLVSISVIFRDPEVAVGIANQYSTELQNYLNKNSLSYGKKNRVFLGEQLEKTKTELSEAENNLKDFQEKYKIINIDAQAEMIVKTVANLKAEILSRDLQLGMANNTTGLNTNDAMKIMDEKKEIEKQLLKMEQGNTTNKNSNKSNIATSVKDFPSVEVEYLRLKRTFLILEKVYELLTSQYEIAKIEEIRDQVAFQVIDKAITPMRKYRPRIVMNTLLTILGTLISSLLIISLLEAFEPKKI